MKTISILSQKGGSGKTTLALHLAVAAYQQGQSVIISDLDPQASATMWHQARDDKQPHVQPTHPASIGSLISSAESQGVDLLIFDTAPQSDNMAVAAAEAADLILITCKPSVMDLRAIQNTLRLRDVARMKPTAQSFVVLTQIEAFGSLHEEARTTLQKLAVDVLPYGMGRRVAYHHGLITGETALEYEPDGKAAIETRNLFQHVSSLDCMTSGYLQQSTNQKDAPHVEVETANA